MAEAPSSIFNKRATERLRNPDDLDKYIQVTNPSVWAALGACIALLAGLLIWGIFGAVTTSVSATSVVVNGDTMCFLTGDDVSKVTIGDKANIENEQMVVQTVGSIPLSRKEAATMLESDYLASTLLKDEWAYLVTFKGDASTLAENVPLNASITVDRVTPISLILKNWG